MPKVSVVIPFYNAIKYLPETVDTVLQQTYGDYEVIIVNDGSTDNIEDWIRELAHPKVHLINQENQGCAGARNTGIQQSSGEYIAILDADDLWHPTKLEKQVNLMDRYPEAGLVYTWSDLIDEQGQIMGRVFKPNAEGKVWEKLLEQNLVGGGSVPLIRRSYLDQSGLFDPNLLSFVEDWDLWLRIAPLAEFKVVKEALVYYRQLTSSASMDWSSMEKSYQIMIEKAFASAPASMQHKKAKCCGLVNLYLAWKPLKSKTPSPQAGWDFQRKAITYYPPIIFTAEFWRLSLSILLTHWLGASVYRQCLNATYEFRRRLRHPFTLDSSTRT
jgi:glycosyltransferase involved in cell wall biosynthesis